MADTPPDDAAATDPHAQPVPDNAPPPRPGPSVTAGRIHQPPVPPGGRGPGAWWRGRGRLPLLLAGLVALLIGCAVGGTVVAAFAVVAGHHRHPSYQHHHHHHDHHARPGWYDGLQPRGS